MSALTTNRPTANDPFKEEWQLNALEINNLRIEFEKDVIGNWQKYTPKLADEIDRMQVTIGLNQHENKAYVDRYIAFLQSATDLAFERFVNDKKQAVIQSRYEVDYG